MARMFAPAQAWVMASFVDTSLPPSLLTVVSLCLLSCVLPSLYALLAYVCRPLTITDISPTRVSYSSAVSVATVGLHPACYSIHSLRFTVH